MEHTDIEPRPDPQALELTQSRSIQEQLYDSTGYTTEAVIAKIENFKRAGGFERLDKEVQHDFLLWLGYSDSLRDIKKLDLNGKRILTVAGSGEFSQTFIDNDSSQVDVFDYSMFACFFNELKLVATRELTYQEYLNFFITIKEENGGTIFDQTVFERLEPFLTTQARTFFRQIITPGYEELFKPKFTENGAVISRSIAVKHIDDVPFLTSEENFRTMQEKLRRSNVNFKIANINSPDLPVSDYDFVYISNISYINQIGMATQLLHRGAKRVGFTFDGTIDLPSEYYPGLSVDTETGELIPAGTKIHESRRRKVVYPATAYIDRNGKRTVFTLGASFIYNNLRITIVGIAPEKGQKYLAQAELAQA